MSRLLLFLLYLSTPYTTVVGQEYLFTHFDESKGLLDSDVYACTQGPEGYMWFATGSGVARFDGQHFESFTTEDGLTDNDIIGIYSDSEGRIWFETFSGIPCFYSQGKIFNPSNSELLSTINLSSFILSTFEDSKGNIWIGTKNEIYKVNPQSGTSLKIDTTRGINFWEFQDSVYSFSANWNQHMNLTSGQTLKIQDYPGAVNYYSPDQLDKYSPNEIIINREKDLFLYNLATKEWVSIETFNATNQSKILKPIVIGNDVFVPTLRGCYHFNKRAPNAIELFLQDIDTRDVKVDHEQNIWFCTNQGIFLLRSKNITNIFNNQRNYRTISVGQDILMASDANGSLFSYQPNSKSPSAVLNLPEVIRKAYYHDGQFSFGSNFGLHRIQNGELNLSIERSSIKDIIIRNDTAFLFLATAILSIPDFSSLDTSATTNSLVASGRIELLHAKRSFTAALIKGEILVGMPAGLFKFMRSEFLPLIDKNQIGDDRITTINYFDNYYYLGTSSNGLFRCPADFSKAEAISGGPSRILKIVQYEGQIIVLGKNKLYQLKEAVMTPIATTASNEIMLHDCTIFDQKIYLATAEGVWRIENLHESSGVFSPILSLKISNQTGEPLIQGQTFSRDLTFNFKAITFSSQSFQYEYQLGDSDHWITTNEPQLSYNNLSPGDYQLKLRVRNQGGEIVSRTSSSFQVRAYIWEKTYFKLVAGLLMLVLIVNITRFFQNRKQQKTAFENQLKIRLMEAEASAFRAQMNPHFVFNSLNSIQGLVLQKKTEEAYKYLGTFSKLVRSILKNSRSNKIKIGEEINFLEMYLEIESLRFGDQFSHQFELIGSIPRKAEIPSMVIQPFIENAIIHGLIHSSKIDPRLHIQFQSEEDLVVCTITDNGVGRAYHNSTNANSRSSLGLQMIKERFALYNHGPKISSFEIIDLQESGTPSGTQVILSIYYEDHRY